MSTVALLRSQRMRLAISSLCSYEDVLEILCFLNMHLEIARCICSCAGSKGFTAGAENAGFTSFLVGLLSFECARRIGMFQSDAPQLCVSLGVSFSAGGAKLRKHKPIQERDLNR